MTDTIVSLDCSTGDNTVVPMTADEQAQRDADVQVAATGAQQQATSDGNASTIQQRALSALNANANYLAITSPTNTQVVAQVQTLTKECNGLIRLLLRQLDSTTNT